MRQLSIFNLVTLDGYFAGEGGDISWHAVDAEFNKFAEQNVTRGNTLIFGRVTYQLMAGYWPTPEARKDDPIIAAGMNKATKIVFSRTLDKVDWDNTTLIKTDLIAAIRKMKRQSGKDMTVLGSGTIVSQLTQARLIDEYQILVIPVVIGKGRTMFEGVTDKLVLKLKDKRVFGNGNVLLRYEPARDE